MKILVLNSGSSSLKYEVFDLENLNVLARGIVEKIGEEGSFLRYRVNLAQRVIEETKNLVIPDHDIALKNVLNVLLDGKHGVIRDKSEVVAIGHRVVHGGETFHSTAIIDGKVIDTIRENINLAPLHNPPNLKGIEVARRIFTEALQVAVFDTAFHHSIPRKAFIYAIPLEMYQKHKIRRYGFHGTSHAYVAEKTSEYMGKPLEDLSLITVHLGNGASMAAVKNGKCVDTSMGMTPLEGLVMGTRSGDIDPALPFYMAGQLGMSYDAIENLLNRECGLRGLCGTNDMRAVVKMSKGGNEKAKLALDIYCYRIKKYIGAYTAILGGVDAIVFTAGIGENSPDVRSLSCSDLGYLGIEIDEEKNISSSGEIREISTAASRVKILVVPTNEELKIAIETKKAYARISGNR